MTSRTCWLILDAVMLVFTAVNLVIDVAYPKFYGWIPFDLVFLVFWIFFFQRDWRRP